MPNRGLAEDFPGLDPAWPTSSYPIHPAELLSRQTPLPPGTWESYEGKEVLALFPSPPFWPGQALASLSPRISGTVWFTPGWRPLRPWGLLS